MESDHGGTLALLHMHPLQEFEQYLREQFQLAEERFRQREERLKQVMAPVKYAYSLPSAVIVWAFVSGTKINLLTPHVLSLWSFASETEM